MNSMFCHPLRGLAALILAAACVAGCSNTSGEPSRPSPGAVAKVETAAGTDNRQPQADIATDSEVQPAAYTADKPPANSGATKPPFDPIAENGKYFEGWPKPKLALVITGRQDGYLEPCGCSGIEQQKGGLSRRYTFVQQLRDRGWPVAAIDVGSLVRRFGKQAEVQFGVAAEALKKMGYEAVGFGPGDLRLSAGEIVAAVASEKPEDCIFVAANVNLFGLTPKFRIIEAGGMKLGITAVLGKEYQQQVNNSEVEIIPAAEALKGVVDQLKDCDVRILLANATTAEAEALAKQFPTFNYVVEASGIDVPRAQPELVAGTKTRLIEVGHKAMYANVIGFFDDPKNPVRFQRVALDSRYANAPEITQLMRSYQDQLQQLGWDGLGLKSVPHPKSSKTDKLAGQFASAASCKECHPTAYGIWSKTKHAHAMETLTKLDPPKQYDPECVSCHATGWNPAEFFPYITGFDSLAKTPALAGNSCENCHGPAAAHVAAEKGRNTAKRDAERAALKLTVGFAQENVCTKCHDHDNSPNFTDPGKFEKYYWPKVEHKGKK